MNKYQEYFKKYCMDNKKYIHYKLQSQSHTKINEYLNSLKDAKVDEDIAYILDKKVVHSGNEKLRALILNFYDYLLKEFNINTNSNLKDKKLINNPLLRELEIAKYLHKRPNRDEIKNEFNIENRELRKELADLKSGITILDTDIKLDIRDIKSRKLECISTVHPIFLPLNLTEVYALMTYLPELLDKSYDPNKDVIYDILEKIKPQLTEYAISKITLRDLNDIRPKFYEEGELIEKGKRWQILNAMKSGCNCIFYLENETIEGKIYNSSTIITYDNKKIENIDLINTDFEFKDNNVN